MATMLFFLGGVTVFWLSLTVGAGRSPGGTVPVVRVLCVLFLAVLAALVAAGVWEVAMMVAAQR